MEHVWAKIKEYLSSWKTTNFGTGTYLNRSTKSNAFEIGTSGTLTVGATDGVYSTLFVNNTSNTGNLKQTRIIDTSFRLENTCLEFLEKGEIGLTENQTYGLFVHKSVPDYTYFSAYIEEDVRVIAIKPSSRTSTTFKVTNTLVHNGQWYKASDFGLQVGDFAIFIVFPATA